MPANLDPFLPFPSPVKRVIEKVTWKDMRFCFSKTAVVTTPPRSVRMRCATWVILTAPSCRFPNGIEISDYELPEGC